MRVNFFVAKIIISSQKGYGPVQVDHRHAVAVHDLHRLVVVFDDHVVDGFVVQHCNDTCDVSETAGRDTTAAGRRGAARFKRR